MLQHEVIVRKGWSWGLLPLLAAALVACGSEEDDGAGGKEEPLGPARVVFAVENLDLLGPVTVQALGRTWVFAPTEGGEAAVTECGEDAVEVEAEEIAVTATSQAGFEWEFTRSLRRGECNVVPVSLENPTTAILAYTFVHRWDLGQEVRLDGEKVGEVEDIVEDQDLWWLERVFEAECCRQVARRLLLELGSAGKAVLVVAPPGTYEIERPGPGGDVVTESVELLPGHVGYLVVDTF